MLQPGVAFGSHVISQIKKLIHVDLVKELLASGGSGIRGNGRQVVVHFIPAGKGIETVEVAYTLGLDQGEYISRSNGVPPVV